MGNVGSNRMTTHLKVYLCGVRGNINESDRVMKIVRTKKQAEQWLSRMNSMARLHNKYFREGLVRGSTSESELIQALINEAGTENYGLAFFQEFELE